MFYSLVFCTVFIGMFTLIICVVAIMRIADMIIAITGSVQS